MIFVLQLIVAIMAINIKIKQINNIFLNTMALKNSNKPIRFSPYGYPDADHGWLSGDAVDPER